MEKNNFISPKKESELDNILMGIERISSGENLFENTKCSLCYLIPALPNRSICCENIICKICSKSWINKNHKECPICRNENFQTVKLNRFEMNIFQTIKYFCDFKSKGCKVENLTIDQISKHEKNCEYNENKLVKCEKCNEIYFKKSEEEHDCIKILLQKNKELLNKLEELNIYKEKINDNNINDFKNDKKNSIFEKEYSYINHSLT